MKSILISVTILALALSAYLFYTNQQNRTRLRAMETQALSLSNIVAALEKSMKASELASQSTNQQLSLCSSNLQRANEQMRALSNQWTRASADLEERNAQLVASKAAFSRLQADHQQSRDLSQALSSEKANLEAEWRAAREQIQELETQRASALQRLQQVEVEHARLLKQWNDPYALQVREEALKQARRPLPAGRGKLELMPDNTVRISSSQPAPAGSP